MIYAHDRGCQGIPRGGGNAYDSTLSLPVDTRASPITLAPLGGGLLAPADVVDQCTPCRRLPSRRTRCGGLNFRFDLVHPGGRTYDCDIAQSKSLIIDAAS